MNVIETLVGNVASQPPSILNSIYQFLLPQERGHHGTSYLGAGINELTHLAHTGAWFVLVGLVVYCFSLARNGRAKLSRFSYPHPIREPGEKFSLTGALSFLLPPSFYKHGSVRIDLLWIPFSVTLGFLGLLGSTLGVGVVQGWMLHQFGPSLMSIPESGLAVTLQVIIILLARDFGRFVWHYQGHTVPFFWEFHKGHHSAEVLHPFGVRTHPVDMFIRNTYTGAGGGLIAGSLIYLLGMSLSLTALSVVAFILAISAVFEVFEHSHVRVSFGPFLDRFMYAPYMHHFHHGALEKHMNVNLGITGGLILWDWLFGTLYRPEAGEKIVWGASMQELGENNPHRTLWGFVTRPFIEAVKTLRRRPRSGDLTPETSGSNAPVA